MLDDFPSIDAIAHATARLFDVLGIGVIVLGGLVATAIFLSHFGRSFDNAYHHYRKHLGRAILLGLEFLVAADIIRTVAVEPTFSNLGVLGAIVLIRTFLSFSIEAEISGRWPWQRGGHDPVHSRNARRPE